MDPTSENYRCVPEAALIIPNILRPDFSKNLRFPRSEMSVAGELVQASLSDLVRVCVRVFVFPSLQRT